MRTKVTLALLFLNVVLFFFIFHFERDWRTERVAMEDRKRVLLGAEAADIRELSVESAVPNQSFRLEKRDGDWYLTKPLVWRANPLAVDRMISYLGFLEHEASFSVREVQKNGQSLADYGLDHPRLVVTLTSGGRDTTGAAPAVTTLRIGDTVKTGERLYLLSPDGSRIHVVRRELADNFSLPLAKLRSDTVLSIPVFEAASLNLQASPPSGVRVLLQRLGNRWLFETPIPARADKDAIELVVNALDALRVKSFVTGVPAPKDEPSLTVTIEGDKRHETLFFGADVPGTATPGGGRDLYAQLEGLPAIFVVTVPPPGGSGPDLLATLRNASEALRDRHVLEFDPSAVTVITLQAPDQPDLILHRLEPDGASGAAAGTAAADAAWQIVLRGDAGQGPTTLAADRLLVQRLLDNLSALSVQQFKSDAPQASDMENWGFKLPARTITLAQSAPPPGAPRPALTAAVGTVSEISLEIGRGDQRDTVVYARQAKPLIESVYAVSPEILRQTPLAPSAWRERTLAELPAVAKITALKLTDVTAGKVLLDWTAATPPSPPVAAVLEALRVLRARSFIPGGFAATVKLDGEDRPWRYRLDATIALPTGAGGERTSLRTLWLAERAGGDEQLAGSKEFSAVFAIEQPFLDALWTLTYGARDPGPPAATAAKP